MNRLGIVLLFFFAASTSLAQKDIWRSQNPPTVAGNLKAVQMISQYTTYVVGEATTFIAVSDSGRKWAVHDGINPDKYKRYLTLLGLSFIDSIRGMTVGPGMILKTTDAGNNWAALKTEQKFTYTGVLMLSPDIAIVIGNSNILQRTIDGGNTWIPYPLEIGIDLKSIKKVRDDLIVISAEDGYVLFSNDSGVTWEKKKMKYGNTVNSIAFEDEKKAVAVGELGFVVSTTDQGDNWTIHTWDTMATVVTSHLYSVDTKVPGYYVAVGSYQTLIYSSDGGSHWNKGNLDIFLTTGLDFNAVWMWDRNYGFAVGNIGALVRTTDGGATWDFIPQDPLFARMYGIAFPKGDTSHGIAVGSGPSALITSDGGTHWKAVTPPIFKLTSQLYSVCYADDSTAYASGDSTIFKTTDFGVTWTTQKTPTTKSLFSVCFIDHNNGWAAGAGNVLLQTKSGGNSWYHVFNNDSKDSVMAVSFCDAMNGITGKMRTTNGGFSWDTIPDPVQTKEENYYNYWGVYIKSKMISPTHYVSIATSMTTQHGMYGTIVTHIGDSTYYFGDWITTYFIKFNGIDFADSLHGTVVGSSGTIYQTTDGGRTWNLQESRTGLQLEAVSMPQPYVSSTSGIRGIILRRTNTDPLASVSEASINSSFEIVSAYPNPASTISKIVISLSRPMPLEAQLFTQLGAEVKNIDLGMLPDGQFEIPISLTDLSSGTYILKISSPDEAKHIQLKIIK